MTYEQATDKLRDNHLYPITHKELGKDKKEKITGLEIACNSLTWERRKELIEEVIGTKFRITYHPNELMILITKK